MDPGGRGRRKTLASDDARVSDNTNARTAERLAEFSNTSGSSIDRTKAVRENAPDLFEQMQNGEIKTNTAYNEMRKREKTKQLEEKANANQQLQDQPEWTLIHDDVIGGLASVRSHHSLARLICSDPPYNVGIDYGNGNAADRLPDGEYMAWVSQWLSECVDLLTDDGSLWVMIGDEYAAEYCLALKDCGLKVRSWIKWYETFGVNCSHNFNRTSRHIFYCVRDSQNFVFNEGAATCESARQAKYNDKRANQGGKLLDDVWTIPRLTGTCSERLPDFPTQLPLELVRRIVLCASEPGDLVLDPFNGSGTTGVACVESGRRYIGIDKSETFITKADLRLKGTTYAV